MHILIFVFFLFTMFCLPYFVLFFVLLFRYHLFWHQAFTTWQWWDNYFSTNSQKPRYFCFVWFDTNIHTYYIGNYMCILSYIFWPSHSGQSHCGLEFLCSYNILSKLFKILSRRDFCIELNTVEKKSNIYNQSISLFVS